MTKFYSSERPNSGGARPSWHQAPLVALPQLCLYPSDKGIATSEEGYYWRAQLMLPNGKGYSWRECLLHREEIPRLLADWYEDPEGACEHYFQSRPQATSLSNGRMPDEGAGVREIEKTSGDLGL